MAFPNYSLMIVEARDPQTNVTSRDAYIFTDVKDAKVAYKAEIQLANRRVFLFEQPQPTKCRRADDVPLPTHPVSGKVFLDTWD